MFVEITKGDSAGEVVEVPSEKGARMVAAGCAVEVDKPKTAVRRSQKSTKKATDEAK